MPTYSPDGAGYHLRPVRRLIAGEYRTTVALQLPNCPPAQVGSGAFQLVPSIIMAYAQNRAEGRTNMYQLVVSHGQLLRMADQPRYCAIHDADGVQVGYISVEMLIFHMRHFLHVPLTLIARLIGVMPDGRTVARASNVGAWYVRYCDTYGYTVYRSQSQIHRPASTSRTTEPQDDSRTTELPSYMTETAMAWFDEVGVTYGHEIEVSALNTHGALRVLRTLPDLELRQGTDYSHQVMREWKVVPDGTVASETVSPVMRGSTDFMQVRRVMQALKAGGARITARCGGHVHFGVEHLTQHDRARIIEAHSRLERMFDKFCRSHRRGIRQYTAPRSTNEARLIAEQFVTNFGRRCTDVNGQDVMRGEVLTYSSRYKHFNVCSYSRYGTFENRQLEGCLNAKKMFAWLCLNFAFFKACETGLPYEAGAQPIVVQADCSTDTWIDQLNIVKRLSNMPEEIYELIKSFMDATN